MTKYVIYTDGACIPNPGKGGWAYLNVNTGEYDSGGVAKTTNNRMELLAICKGLMSVTDPAHITIKTDSQYAIKIANKATRPDKNPDLWVLLHELLKFHKVDFQWVKGHAKDTYNNYVDGLANQQAS